MSDISQIGLDVTKLRSITSNFVADWLQVLVQLIDGSTEGNPAVNGQTVEEEDTLYGDFSGFKLKYVNHFQKRSMGNTSNHPIPTQSSDIRNWDVKIYGGTQLEVNFFYW